MKELEQAVKRARAGSMILPRPRQTSSSSQESSSSSSNHQAEVQDLLRDKPHFEEQYAQWWHRQRQNLGPVLYPRELNDKATMEEIASYTLRMQENKERFERMFIQQTPTGHNNQPLTLAKTKLMIEDTYLFLHYKVIPLAVQRFVGKHDLTYAPMSDERKDVR